MQGIPRSNVPSGVFTNDVNMVLDIQQSYEMIRCNTILINESYATIATNPRFNMDDLIWCTRSSEG
jgi:hypothetical protein